MIYATSITLMCLCSRFWVSSAPLWRLGQSLSRQNCLDLRGNISLGKHEGSIITHVADFQDLVTLRGWKIIGILASLRSRTPIFRKRGIIRYGRNRPDAFSAFQTRRYAGGPPPDELLHIRLLIARGLRLLSHLMQVHEEARDKDGL